MLGMDPVDEVTGARIVMTRRLAWHETDASGHNHFAAAMRWVEEAEHQLYRCIGETDHIPVIPRVHIEVDYRARLFFNDVLKVNVGVIKVGGSSCTFGFAIDREDGVCAVSGRVVIVHASSTTEGSAPWPATLRDALAAPRDFLQVDGGWEIRDRD
jgi:acyl-CoA thioester hydrolase